VMTVVALIFTPLVLVYQGWSYWVFRARVRRPGDAEVPSTSDHPPPGAPSTAAAASTAPVVHGPTTGDATTDGPS